MSPENTTRLIKDFPILYPSMREDKTPWGMFRSFDCGDGWFELVRDLSEKLEDVLRALPEDERFGVTQVKEKFGGLRFYVGGVPHEVFDLVQGMIREAEGQSLRTCEVTGKPGRLRTKRGWDQTLCDEVAAEEGWETVEEEASYTWP